MVRSLTLGMGLLALIVSPVRAQDIKPDVVDAVKKATVYIRVETDTEGGTGSGFVIWTQGETALIATNHHVVKTNKDARGVQTSVIFDSGTRSERSVPGEIVAQDTANDLAILRVHGVKNMPRPIPYQPPTKAVELMPVYSFGFPFGESLSVGKGNPAITIGKATVSSLRNGDDGELAIIQLDGNINPGNSGGPIVDPQGRLVGVVVATIRDSSGIGLIIPGDYLVRLMNGRIEYGQLAVNRSTPGKIGISFRASTSDPMGNLRGASLYYTTAAAGAEPPRTLDKVPGIRKVPVTLTATGASAEFTIDAIDGDVQMQIISEHGSSRTIQYNPVQSQSLAPVAMAAMDGGRPPSGWKVHVTNDRVAGFWIPNDATVTEMARMGPPAANPRERRLSGTVFTAKHSSGVDYRAGMILRAGVMQKLTRKDLELLFTIDMRNDGGRIFEEKEILMGRIPGKEILGDVDSTYHRVRILVMGDRIWRFEAIGPRRLVDGPLGMNFLVSAHVPGADQQASVIPPRPGTPPSFTPPPRPVPGMPSLPRPIPGPGAVVNTGREPRTLGFRIGQPFQEIGPTGALLVGLELGMNREFIRSVQPIYRQGDKETVGALRGTSPGPFATIKAKPGYAIGALTVRFALGLYGMSATFMRIGADGKLNPKDAYESEWVGSKGGRDPVKIGGDGTPAFGIAGRGDETQIVALGVVIRGDGTFRELEGKVQRAGDGALVNMPADENAGTTTVSMTSPTPRPNGTTTLPASPSNPATPANPAAKNPNLRIEKITRKPGEEPAVFHGGNDLLFKEVGPANSLLVGFEVGLGKFFNRDMVRTVRPIYRVGTHDVFGQTRGTAPLTITLKAKPGYAVGNVTFKGGLWFDAFSVTFMKVKGDRLDPSDSYDSEWVGDSTHTHAKCYETDGTPIVGLTGRENRQKDAMTGFGLIFKDDK